MKAYRKMCYNFNEFFILFSLIPLSVSSSFFFSNTDQFPHIFSSPHIFLLTISSLPRPRPRPRPHRIRRRRINSTSTPTPTPTPTHHFHTDLSLTVVSVFFFFFAVVWWVGWAMGGFRWIDRWWVGSDGQIGVHHAAPPISHSQIRSPCFFFWWTWVEFHGF